MRKSAKIIKKNTTICLFLVIGIFFFNIKPIAGFQKKTAIKDPVELRILPTRKNGVFDKKSLVKYSARIKNNSREEENGWLVYKITNEKNTIITTGTIEIKVAAKKTIDSFIEIPFDTEGFYKIDFSVKLTNYSGELNDVFSYYPNGKKSKKSPIYENRDAKNLQFLSSAENEVSENKIDNTSITNISSEEVKVEGEILTVIKPKVKNGVFSNGNNIVYSVKLSNTYKTKQKGTFTFILKNDKGDALAQKTIPIKIAKKGTKVFKITSPPVKEPGIYGISAALNLTTYDDTTKHAFAYKVNNISTPYNKPPDFEDFWNNAKADLAAIDPNYSIKLDDSYTTKFHKVYKVEMSSLDGVRIFGWLSIPRLPKNFPLIIGLQGYKVELKPLYYDNFIGFNINTRGIEKNWGLFNPENIEPFLFNIEEKEKYMYRGIYMDCLRAIDFIFSQKKMGFDHSRILLFGGSQGAALSIVTAALSGNKINAIVVDNPVYCDFHESFKLKANSFYDNFPVNRIVEYTQKNPSISTEVLLDNLSYFEVQNFMPRVNCSVLYAVSLLDPLAPAATLISAYNKLRPSTLQKSEIVILPNLGHEVSTDHKYYSLIWMNEKLVRKR